MNSVPIARRKTPKRARTEKIGVVFPGDDEVAIGEWRDAGAAHLRPQSTHSTAAKVSTPEASKPRMRMRSVVFVFPGDDEATAGEFGDGWVHLAVSRGGDRDGGTGRVAVGEEPLREDVRRCRIGLESHDKPGAQRRRPSQCLIAQQEEQAVARVERYPIGIEAPVLDVAAVNPDDGESAVIGRDQARIGLSADRIEIGDHLAAELVAGGVVTLELGRACELPSPPATSRSVQEMT